MFQIAQEKNVNINFLAGAVYLLRTSLKLELTTVFRTTTGVIVLSFHLRSFCIVGGRTAPITDVIPNNLKVLIIKHINFIYLKNIFSERLFTYFCVGQHFAI